MNNALKVHMRSSDIYNAHNSVHCLSRNGHTFISCFTL